MDPFNVNDIVKVVNKENDSNVETYYYLKEFENKEGKIIEIIKKPKLQYKVLFRNGEGYFYHEELKRISWILGVNNKRR